MTLDESVNGEHHPELHDEPPEELSHIWDLFIYLSNRRSFHQVMRFDRQQFFSENIPNRISFTEIKAWTELCGITLTSTETTILVRLDDTFINSVTAPPEASPVEASQEAIKRAFRARMNKGM